MDSSHIAHPSCTIRLPNMMLSVHTDSVSQTEHGWVKELVWLSLLLSSTNVCHGKVFRFFFEMNVPDFQRS